MSPDCAGPWGGRRDRLLRPRLELLGLASSPKHSAPVLSSPMIILLPSKRQVLSTAPLALAPSYLPSPFHRQTRRQEFPPRAKIRAPLLDSFQHEPTHCRWQGFLHHQHDDVLNPCIRHDLSCPVRERKADSCI